MASFKPFITATALAVMAPAFLAASNHPLRFEENRGQTGSPVRYLARARGENIFFADRCIYIELEGKSAFTSVVRMSFPGANGSAAWRPAGNMLEPVSYFVGSDRSRWVRDAKSSSRLERKNIYPGIDAVFYGENGRLEYDLVLARGADPSAVRLQFDGDAHPRLLADGSIELHAAAGTLVQRVPHIYQENASGERIAVPGRFVSARGGEFRLDVGAYDRTRALIVDPEIEFASYLGGDGDDEIKVVGPNFVAGNTSSVAFPGVPAARRRSRDIFIRGTGTPSYPPLGVAVIGGSGDDDLTCATMVQQSSSQADYYLGGATTSRDFPTGYSGSLTYAGGATDGFVVHISSAQYGYTGFNAFLIGGSGEDRVTALTSSGSEIAGAGVTDSPDLPVTHAFQPNLAGGKDGFLFYAYTYNNLTALTYFGASGDDRINTIVAVSGGFLVGGETSSPDFPLAGWPSSPLQGPSDGFVALVPFDLSTPPTKSMLIGGSGEDRVQAIAVATSSMYNYATPVTFAVAGTTTSPDFPLKNPLSSKLSGPSDAFAARFVIADGSMAFSTYIGGSGVEEGVTAAMDFQENFVIAGLTRSNDLPVYQAIQSKPGGGDDGFLAYIDFNNQLQQLTYYGGSGDDRIYGVSLVAGPARIAGSTTSTDLPVKAAWQESKDSGLDGFVADIPTRFISGPDQIALGKDLDTSYLFNIPATSGTMTLRSADPTKVRFVLNGQPQNEITVARNNYVMFEGLADSGQVEVTISADGIPSKIVVVRLLPTAISCSPTLTLSTWVSSFDLTGSCYLAAWNSATSKVEALGSLRSGVPNIQWSWSSSDPSVAQVSVDPNNGDSLVSPVAPGTVLLTMVGNSVPSVPPGYISVAVVRPSLRAASVTLGKDFQVPLSTSFTAGTGALGYSVPKGQVTFRSSDPSRLLLTADSSQPGQEAVTVNLASYYTLYAQALAGDGPVRISATSTELADVGNINVNLVPLTATMSAGTGTLVKGNNTDLAIAFTNGNSTYYGTSIRPGVKMGAAASSSDSTVVTVNPAAWDLSSSSVRPSLTAVSPGEADITLTLTGTDMPVAGPLHVKVLASATSLNPPPTVSPIYVGKDLRTDVSIRFYAPSNSEATITVADPGLVLVSADGKSTGQTQIRKIFYDTLSFTVHGLASSGQTTIHVSVPGFGDVDGTVILGTSGIAFSSNMVSTSFYSKGATRVGTYLLDDVTGIPLFAQSLRPGVSVDVNLHQNGSLVTIAPQVITLTSDTDTYTSNITFTPQGVGDTDLSFDQPAGFAVASRLSHTTLRVVASTITIEGAAVGAHYGTVSVTVRASADVTVTSADPSKLLLSSAQGAAAASVVVHPNGVLGLIALTDSGSVTIQLSGTNMSPMGIVVPLNPIQVSVSSYYNSQNLVLLSQTAPISLSPIFGLAGWSVSLTLRPDAPPLRLQCTSSDPSVVSVDPAVIDLTSSTRAFTIKPGTPGTAELRFSVPAGYTLGSDRIPVTVRAPKFQLQTLVLGKDMQASVQVTPESSGTPVDSKILTLTSLSPDRLLLSRSATAPGSASITIAYQGGSSQSQYVYIQALAGDGTADIRISADGYADSTSTVQLVPSGFTLNSYPAKLEIGGQFQPQITFTTLTSSGTASYPLRAGADPVTITLTSSDPSVISPSAPSMVFEPGDYSKIATVQALAVGKATLSLNVPANYADPGIDRRSTAAEVTLRTLSVRCDGLEVGKDTQQGCTVGGMPAGISLTVTSSQPGLLLVSSDGYKKGSAQTVVNGYINVYVQALADSGSADVTFTAPDSTPIKYTFQLRPAAFVLDDALIPQQPIAMTMGNPRSPTAGARLIEPDGTVGGYVSLRGGLAPVQVYVTTTNPSAFQVPDSITFSPGSVNQYVQITPKTPGNGAVSLSQPAGFAASPKPQALYLIK